MEPEVDKKYSYLDQYRILRTLGAGYHAQVKLAMDDNGNTYAIKRYKKETASLSTLQHQLNIMKELKHQNLVQLIDVRENATYKRKDQSTFQCFAIIIEYVGGGQLFDYIAETGKFSEKVSRTYFHQMMNGLHYMHSKGYAHRDIKPQNILLARDFALKLADFGFSCLVKGKDGSGILHTKLGTEGYMAPQIPTKNYEGTSVDVFAAGVILFIMYAGNPPFEKASPNDPYYRLIKDKNYGVFWKAHSRRRPVNFFNDQFKDIFTKMVAFNPEQRPKIEEIAAHEWVKNTVCTQGQIAVQFQQRQKRLDDVLEQRRIQQEQQRKKNVQVGKGGSRGQEQGQTLFSQIYQQELQAQRQLPQLNIFSADDFLINENSVYAVSLLKQFFKAKKIQIEQEGQLMGEEVAALKVENIQESKDGKMNVKYEYSFQIDGDKFKQVLELGVTVGKRGDKVVICFEHQDGSRLYYKKVVKEIKNIYANCLA